MDREELYQKAEQVLTQAFEAAKKSVKVVAEKTGEAAHIAKLLVEKVTLEHRVTKQFTRMGGRLYAKAAGEGESALVQDPELGRLINETKELESQLSKVDAALAEERKGKKRLAGKRPRS